MSAFIEYRMTHVAESLPGKMHIHVHCKNLQENHKALNTLYLEFESHQV